MSARWHVVGEREQKMQQSAGLCWSLYAMIMHGEHAAEGPRMLDQTPSTAP